MVSSDRSGANLLHASLAGSGKDWIYLTRSYWNHYDDQTQHDRHAVPLLLLWPCMGVRMS
jgi:hypothetical protein